MSTFPPLIHLAGVRLTMIFRNRNRLVVLSLSWACLALPAREAPGEPLPTAYDLRSVATPSGTVAWVSNIQDQGQVGDCWTFASATAMDSNLLMQGLLATGSVAPRPEVSSWHLSMANGNPNDTVPAKVYGNSNWGGFEYEALGYLTRGSGQWTIPGNPDAQTQVTTFGGGPVSNTNRANRFPEAIASPGSPPYPSDLIKQYLPPVDQATAWRVTNVAMLDQGFSNNVPLPEHTGKVTIDDLEYRTYSYTLGAADPQVQAVKQAILAHGAVSTSMNADYHAFFHPAVDSHVVDYVNPQTATGYSDHEVTIIGWSDSHTITSSLGATTTGAWLVQNSWGTEGMGDAYGRNDGTFWAPYDDAVIGRSGVASFQLAPMTGWSQTVLQNELGPMAYAANFETIGGTEPKWNGHPTGMATVDAASRVMSILTPSTTEVLAGLGMATQVAGVDVTASIYEWNAATLSVGTLLEQATFFDEWTGFFFGDLPQLTVIGGRSYAVVLDYAKNGSPLGGAAGVTIGGSGINGYRDGVTAGLSYYFDPSSSQWIDMSTLHFKSYSDSGGDASGGILFLKGYLATVPEIDPAGLSAALATAMAALGIAERRPARRR